MKIKIILYNLLLLCLFTRCTENINSNDKSNTIKRPSSVLSPLIINSVDFADFFEELNKKGMDTVIKWIDKELIVGRIIIRDNNEGIICDKALRRLDQQNNPLDIYVVPYQNGINNDNNCTISSVTSSPYMENPVQLEIRTFSNENNKIH